MASKGALVTVDRQYLYHSFQDGLKFTFNEAFQKDNHYTLFRSEDKVAWFTFTAVFIALIALDNCILNRNPKALTMGRAIMFTVFWVLCAAAFCGWVYWYYGQNQAFMWMSGYMLEWMLSFDNLFVFHMIFSVYQTPDHLKHRPLYLGICGAIVFRLAFIFIGEYLMHAMFFMHFVFGAFLIYTGVKTAMADEEDEDPSQHPMVQWLQRQVPFVSYYDEKGSFFVNVPVDSNGDVILPEECKGGWRRSGSATEGDRLARPDEGSSYGAINFSAYQGSNEKGGQRYQMRATMLFLVVCCLEISDLLFAVDSVSAIVAQVNDLFLAYTSAVFAMLGLRAMFFVIDVLAQMFTLLKYGVAAVLCFIGVKLIVSRMYHIPPAVVCIVLVSAIGSSMVASVLQDRWSRLVEDILSSKSLKRSSPAPTPTIKEIMPKVEGGTMGANAGP